MIFLNLSHEQNVMRQMCADRVKFPLFVGGYSSGKSFILVHNAAQDVLSFPGCRVAVYAPTYDLLELNLVPAFEQYFEEMGVVCGYNKSKHILMIEGGRKIIFRPMCDPARIVAYEVYSSHVDEADLLRADKAAEVWDRIIARNRQKHPQHGKQTNNIVAAYSTPESYRFTYQRWKKSPGEGYIYVQAPTWSNKTNSPSYIKGLVASYTPQQQAAYLAGIWTNLNSGNVYSYFDEERHKTNRKIERSDILRIGQDFNVGGCCGAVYVVDRWVENGDYRLMISQVDEFACENTYRVIEHVGAAYPDNRCVFYPDSTGNKTQSNASASDIAIIRAAGYEVRANSINPPVEDRVNSVQRLFSSDLLYINPEKCPQSFAARLEHAYSKLTEKPEKFAGPGTIDDRNDAGDYPLANMFPIREPIDYSGISRPFDLGW